MRRVVIADPLGADGVALLRRELEVVEAIGEVGLAEALPEAEGLVVRSRTKVTAEMLANSGRLRVVGRAGIGVDNIDVPAATRRGILVINAPQGSVRAVAEHTLALIFALARRVVAADRSVRDGSWKAGYEGMQLAGKRLGIIGAGKIGRATAAMAVAIGMDIVAYDPYVPDTLWPDLGLQAFGLRELLASSDVVTLHVPLSSETRGLLGAGELRSMKTGAILVNCARGGLVDEAALGDVLREGRLGGAALDVFEEEPVAPGSPLLAAPNLILTPHVAASTPEAQAQIATDLAGDILRFFAGCPVSSPVNPSVLEK